MSTLNLESRIRSVLRLVNQQAITDNHLRDSLTKIDEIIANETGRGNEISPGYLSGERAVWIQRQEWGLPKQESKCECPCHCGGLEDGEICKQPCDKCDCPELDDRDLTGWME